MFLLKTSQGTPDHAGTVWVSVCLIVATGKRKCLACNAQNQSYWVKGNICYSLGKLATSKIHTVHNENQGSMLLVPLNLFKNQKNKYGINCIDKHYFIMNTAI